jgi:hypothetical protein
MNEVQLDSKIVRPLVVMPLIQPCSNGFPVKSMAPIILERFQGRPRCAIGPSGEIFKESVLGARSNGQGDHKVGQDQQL